MGSASGSGRLAVPTQVRDLLEHDPVEVAARLLGSVITSSTSRGAVSVRLTEVEAYRGEEDPGSHAYRGRTPRNASMFKAAGHVYVYFTYGMHHCLNLVCGPAGQARAVLLRGGEVAGGHALARLRRPAARTDRDLARGPARLCAALGLTRDDDGTCLGPPGSHLHLLLPTRQDQPAVERIRRGPRTGVSGPGGDGSVFPWRLWIDGEPTVSPYRPARPQPRRRG
ncbi:DNA-3-methyladenine glycosylase [Actinomyces sp. 2119]|nr:DNA-3-methyladenine glycosylase [Actinomyces sp. 2119]